MRGLEPQIDPDADGQRADDHREGERTKDAHVAAQKPEEPEQDPRGGDAGKESEDETIHVEEPCLPSKMAAVDAAALKR